MSLIADALRKQRMEEAQEDGGRRLPSARPPIAPPPRRGPGGALLFLALLVVLVLAGLTAFLVMERGPRSDDAVAPAEAEVAGVEAAQAVPAVGEQDAPSTVPASAEARPAGSGAVENVVRAWQDSWMQAEPDRHLGVYADDFRPASGDRAAWEAERRRGLEEPAWIALALDDLRIETDRTGGATARFVQTYRDPGRAERAVWRLELRDVGGSWRIVEEERRFLETLPAGEPRRAETAAPVEAAAAASAGGSAPPAARPAPEAAAPPAVVPAAAREIRLADGSVLRLDFIVFSETAPFVQIDGVFLEIGDRISGWQVAEIERESVVLSGPGDERRELRVR